MKLSAEQLRFDVYAAQKKAIKDYRALGKDTPSDEEDYVRHAVISSVADHVHRAASRYLDNLNAEQYSSPTLFYTNDQVINQEESIIVRFSVLQCAFHTKDSRHFERSADRVEAGITRIVRLYRKVIADNPWMGLVFILVSMRRGAEADRYDLLEIKIA